MNEDIIRQYISELAEPHAWMPRSDFYHHSTMIWAANEVLLYVKKNKEGSIIDILEDFIRKMDTYACWSDNPDISYIFSVAHDVAIDIQTRFFNPAQKSLS